MPIQIHILGQEDFKGLRESQMRNKNGYIFVYSIVNFSTLSDALFFVLELYVKIII